MPGLLSLHARQTKSPDLSSGNSSNLRDKYPDKSGINRANDEIGLI